MKNIGIFVLVCSLSAPGIVSAQSETLRESVSVEGVFAPKVVDRGRINLFPQRHDFEIERSQLPFDSEGVVASFVPTTLPLGVTGWNINPTETPRGYVDLQLGSWLNSSLSAGYAVVRNETTHLDVSLQHNSTSLWKFRMPECLGETKRYRYDESLNARFSRLFAGKGIISASLTYHFGYFNYYSYCPAVMASLPSYSPDGSIANADMPKAPTQTLNDISFAAGWNSPTSGKNEWYAAFNARYFGYRSLYLPDADLFSCSGERETHLSVSAGWQHKYSGEVLPRNIFGVDLTGDMLIYNSKKHYIPQYSGLSQVEDYGHFSLTPFYLFSLRNFDFRAGAVLDFTFNADGNVRGSHYSIFHIAPDINIGWHKDAFRVFIDVNGSSELQTLASSADRYYYRMPTLSSTQPVYTPVDCRLGIDIGPFSGFSTGFSAGYRLSKHHALDGWYMALLNYGNMMMPGLRCESGLEGVIPAYSTSQQGIDIRGFNVEFHAEYKLRNILKLSAKGSYQRQDGEIGWYNGIDRPRWTLNAEADIQPISRLRITAGYNYRGVRNIYTCCMTSPGGDSDGASGDATGLDATRMTIIDGDRTPSVGEGGNDIQESAASVNIASLRLADLTDLYARVSFDIMPNMTIGVSAHNLLNQKVCSLPMLPLEGVNILGNLTFSF